MGGESPRGLQTRAVDHLHSSINSITLSIFSKFKHIKTKIKNIDYISNLNYYLPLNKTLKQLALWRKAYTWILFELKFLKYFSKLISNSIILCSIGSRTLPNFNPNIKISQFIPRHWMRESLSNDKKIVRSLSAISGGWHFNFGGPYII